MPEAQTPSRPATTEPGPENRRKYQDGDRVSFQPTDPMTAFSNPEAIGQTGTVEAAEEIVTREFSISLGWDYRVRMDGGAMWTIHDCDLAPAG